MELQLAEAVRIALDPYSSSATKQQVVEEVLKDIQRYDAIGEQKQLQLQRALLDYFRSKYGSSNGAEPVTIASLDTKFIKNKLAQVVTLIFIRQYPEKWPTFFDELLALLPSHVTTHPNTAPSGNSMDLQCASIIDIFLRICLAIDQEVVNLLINRGKDATTRNNYIKDIMRGGAVQRLVATWFLIIVEYHISHPDLAVACLQNVGLFISWIDVHLIVNDKYIPLIFGFLLPNTITTQTHALRMAATDCLVEIVSKGMKSTDKLSMIQAAGIVDVLDALCTSIMTSSNQNGLSGNDDNQHNFVEAVAKLVNILGYELVLIHEQADLEPQLRPLAWTYLYRTFVRATIFLSNEYDDISMLVYDFCNELLNLLKRQRKTNGTLTVPETEMISSLLNIVIAKMKYDKDTVFPDGVTANTDGDDEDEDEDALFQQMRKQLKGIFDNIALISPQLWSDAVSSVIMNILKQAETGVTASWMDVELALHVLYLFGESQKGVATYQAGKAAAGATVVTADGNLTVLGQLVIQLIKSNVANFPHPLIAPLFFELVVRYADFFERFPDAIAQVLGVFIDHRGLHNTNVSVRSRTTYLFLRFIKATKAKIVPYVETILNAVSDLLVVTPHNLLATTTDNEDLSGDRPSAFETQTNLFETVGILISLEGIALETRTQYTAIVLNPLISSLENLLREQPWSNMSSESAVVWILLARDLISAIGSVSKDYPAYSSRFPRLWQEIFDSAMQTILKCLEALKSHEAIRDSVRFALQRMLHILGPDGFVYLPSMVSALLSQCGERELGDFLSFMGLIMRKYKGDMLPIINDMVLTIIQRVFAFVSQTPTGTDDQILQTDLKRSYLSFLGSLFQCELDKSLLSKENYMHCSTVLQSVTHYASDTTDKQTQRSAVSLMSRFVQAWSGFPPSNLAAIYPHLTSNWFDTPIRDIVARICFEVPLQKSFELADAKSLLVIHELASLQKTMLLKQQNDFIQFLGKVYLPGIQCPDALIQEYLAALQQLDARMFQEYIKSFITQNKR